MSDPATALAIGSSAAGFGSGFFAPEGQELSSFPANQPRPMNDPFTGERRNVFLDAPGTLAEGLGLSRSMFDEAVRRASQPVTPQNTLPSAFVQQPATFSGGGLPFDIGVTGFDVGNPFYSPTQPPGGYSDAANALLNGYRNGAAGGPGGQFGTPPPGLGNGVEDPNGGDGGGGGPPPGNMPTFNNPFPWDRVPTSPAERPKVGPLPPPIVPPTGGGGGDEPGGDIPRPEPTPFDPSDPYWNLIDPPEPDVKIKFGPPDGGWEVASAPMSQNGGMLADLKALGFDPTMLMRQKRT